MEPKAEYKHTFVGSSILCQVCKKSKSNWIHGDERHIIACSHEDCTDPSVYTCGTCSRPVCERHKSLHLNGHGEVYHSKLQNDKPKIEPVNTKPACPSHICIGCGAKWEHIYSCNKPADYQNKCRECASQSTAQINRPAHIDEIKMLGDPKDPIITPVEQKQISLEHYSSIKLMIQDNGELRSNWQEIISQHILSLEKIMLKLRIHSETTRKLRVDIECEEMTKLTQEEREQFAKDAQRLKTKKIVNEVEKKEKSVNKGYNDTLKAIAATLKAKGLSGQALKDKLAQKAELADIPLNVTKEFEI